MPQITCKCGAYINTSASPHPDLTYLFPDREREQFAEDLANTAEVSKDKNEILDEILLCSHHLFKRIPVVYECQSCHRLLVFRSAADAIPQLWLKPEVEGKSDVSIRSLIDSEFSS